MNALRAPTSNDLAERLAPPAATETRSAACLNCGTVLIGQFCSNCGQRDIPPYPSVRELVIDAFWELSGWDGRFIATVRKLFRAPGALTRDFLEGRRARYLSPLRLYLMASLVYFVAAAAAPKREIAGTIDAGAIKIGLGTKEQVEANVRSESDGRASAPVTAASRDSMLAQLATTPKVLRPLLRRAVVDPDGFKRSLTDAMPRALFALLPVFAAIAALFYWRRKYPEHLYFAVHLHAFVFLALTLATVARFAHSERLSSIVGIFVTLWIPIYSTVAFRRTYGGSLGSTIAKELGIGLLYGVAGLIALTATMYWAALFG